MLHYRFPDNKKFAFTIFDDTDKATVENVKPVYDLLEKLGIFTTKSVFVFSNKNPQYEFDCGDSLEDENYLKFIKHLRDKGFEIGFHGARSGGSNRKTVVESLEVFKEKIGYYPKTYANHAGNIESLYWGKSRLNFSIVQFMYRLATINKKYKFEGDNPGSAYFWGDIAKKRIDYIRNFVFDEINLLNINPTIPYRDCKKVYSNFWFSSSEGHNVDAFNKLLNFRNIDKLEREGGVCIIYTHFANGFTKNGIVNKTTEESLFNLSRRNGWFVPVSTLLDFLRDKNSSDVLSWREQTSMEYKWFLSKIIHGTR
jgi:hypothetical protein